MGTRIELHNILTNIMNSNNVYYQPPESIQMVYPAIRYYRSDIESIYADNKKYKNSKRYTIVVISKKPDNQTIERLLELPMSSFENSYVSNNLYHDVVSLYY